MELNGDFYVESSLSKVWGIISDADKFSKCLPNVTDSEIKGDNFRLTFKADAKKYTSKFLGAGYLSSLNVKFSAAIKEKQENKHVLIEGSGSTIGLSFSLSLYLDLAQENEKVHVTWRAKIELGKMAKLFGEDIVGQAVDDIVKQTIKTLNSLL